MSGGIMTRHWSEDPFWTEALDRYCARRDSGTEEIIINVAALENALHAGDSPAYKLLEAMLSVNEHESYDGMRGAPRVAAAFLQMLSELPIEAKRR